MFTNHNQQVRNNIKQFLYKSDCILLTRLNTE